VPRASWLAVCEQKAQLENEVRQKEKRMLRLRQVFAAKSAEFREALSAILGVKIAFYDNVSFAMPTFETGLDLHDDLEDAYGSGFDRPRMARDRHQCTP